MPVDDFDAVAQAFDRSMGDPMIPTSTLSFARAVELDEREEFPADAFEWAFRSGMLDYLVPVANGGKLRSFEEAMAIIRVIARRDLSTAIIIGQTYLGAVHTWLSGSEPQKRRIAELVRSGRQTAFALTEREHGGDVLADDVRAEQVPGGYLLSGEKWLINNGTRAAALTVFARTNPGGGALGFSLFIFDREAADAAGYRSLPKIRTYGVRGADISGVRFDRCFVPAESRIGPEGAGVEIALKGLLVTRTLCAGTSLGAAETALRATLDFALERVLFGDTVFAIPEARRSVVNAFLDLLVCECAGVAAARGLHVATAQFSVWSAVAKYFVPVTVDGLIRDLSVVLGARYYLREGHYEGIFQKMLRDHAVIALFDGSTAVNLNAIALQLASLAAGRQRAAEGERQGLEERLQATFSLGETLPLFEPSRLTLLNRGQDDVIDGASLSLGRVRDLDSGALSPDASRIIVECTSALLLALEAESVAPGTGSPRHLRPEMFEAARRYAACHAAFACLHMWVYNRHRLDEFFGAAEWLALGLYRVARQLGCAVAPPPAALYERVAARLLSLREEGRRFSICPIRLAGSAGRAAVAAPDARPHPFS